MNSLKIIIIDDHPIFRQGMEQVLLQIDPTFQVYQTWNGEGAMEIINKHGADIIFTDARIRGMSGLDLTRHVKKISPSTKILALSIPGDRSSIIDMFRAGANGYLHKNSGTESVKNAIDTIMNGKMYFPEDFSHLLCDDPFQRPSPAPDKKALSEKEIEILILVCKQFSTPEISKLIGLPVPEVESLRASIMEKTNTRNLIGLVMYAIQKGYVLAGDDIQGEHY
jgi:DNA-binding NarL/FixJ family response regulator